MNSSEHLTENQLHDYFGNAALDKDAKHHIGRHLLQCDFCLKRLPQPTTEQFWAALMTDDDAEDSRGEKITLAARLESFAQITKHPKIFALGAASALAVALLCLTFIWLGAAKSFRADYEIVENFEIKETQSVPARIGGGENRNLPPPLSKDENGDGTSSAPNAESKLPVSENAKTGNRSSASLVTNRNLPAAGAAEPKTISKIALRKGEETGEARTTVSSTRGGNVLPKCSDLPPIDLTTGISNETVILKWKKVPAAAKYHLYVSDDDEILIDEFETERETSYTVTKPLAPQKTYQWKVVVTLADGKTIIGNAQKFTIQDLQSSQKKSAKRERTAIRCSESKLNQ